jgi:hypothetical protein
MQYVQPEFFLAGLLIAPSPRLFLSFSSTRDNLKLCQFASANPNICTFPQGFALQRPFHLPQPPCCLAYLMYGSLYHLLASTHQVFFMILPLRNMQSNEQDPVICPSMPEIIEHVMPHLSDGFTREQLKTLISALPGVEELSETHQKISYC